ncbi:MAG: hypothetical protein JZU60_00410 [Ilumatobacteraceae bacterium]|jgi:hypothetical protein|nr:hypothetical protein [Ilumatobacteraceae bacterium]
MLDFDTIPDTWQPLPEVGFVRGRAATAQDSARVFLIPDPKAMGAKPTPDTVSYGLPADLPVPQYALWLPLGAGRAVVAVIVQAEINKEDSVTPGGPSFGLRLDSGYTEIGTDADTVLLGTDLTAIQGLSVRALMLRFGRDLLDCRVDLAVLRQDAAVTTVKSAKMRPRCLNLPTLNLRGCRYAVLASRVFEWYSRILFESNSRGLHGIPMEYRIIDLVVYSECPTREYRFTQYTLADALLERENLTAPEQAVFDAWLAQDQVQSTIAAARFHLKEINPQRAMKFNHFNLYSRLQHFLLHCQLESADAHQWLRTLENACAQGVSRTELAWSGLPEFLALRHNPIHRHELLAALDLGSLRVRVCSEVRCEDSHQREDGTLNAEASYATWVFAHDVRMWPRIAPNNLRGDHYDEWRILAEDDVVTVTEQHFGGQRNAIAHLRTTVRYTDDGESMLCIDEAQADWPAHLLRESAHSTPGTPYRQHWIDVAVRVALQIAADKDIRRVVWISGRIAQETHLQGNAPQLDLIYDHLLPGALRRVLRGTTARFTTAKVPTWSRDWQFRFQGNGDLFDVYHHGIPTGETCPNREAASAELARRAQPIEETLACVEFDSTLQGLIQIGGLPWLGAPDWTRVNREFHGWQQDRDRDLFAPEPKPFAHQRDQIADKPHKLRPIDVEVKLCWDERTTHRIQWTLRIDGQAVLDTLDPPSLIRSAAEVGQFYIFTCTCGAPSCSDIFLPVLVSHTARQIRWDFESPMLLHGVAKGVWQTLAFPRKRYQHAIARALERTRELLQRYPEAGTGISDALWRNVPPCHYDPAVIPPTTKLSATAKRIDIGWFWSAQEFEGDWWPGDFDLLVDGERASLTEQFPLRRIWDAWDAWHNVTDREDAFDEATEHSPKREGSFVDINQRGVALAKAVAKVVPQTVAVWFHPVGINPWRPERVARNRQAVLVRPTKRRLI